MNIIVDISPLAQGVQADSKSVCSSEEQGVGSIPTGGTNLKDMSSRDIVIDEFKLLLQENLRNINMIIKTAE